jgi:predicted DNA-binding transcriptional regulator AlpA
VSRSEHQPPFDLRDVAETLADILIERGLVVAADESAPARILDAGQVAALLGRHRRWVYDHAGELGAFRSGDGPKARLGFDRASVDRWVRERAVQDIAPRQKTRRRTRRTLLNGANLIPYEPPVS